LQLDTTKHSVNFDWLIDNWLMDWLIDGLINIKRKKISIQQVHDCSYQTGYYQTLSRVWLIDWFINFTYQAQKYLRATSTWLHRLIFPWFVSNQSAFSAISVH
jgi:hypothetical protein